MDRQAAVPRRAKAVVAVRAATGRGGVSADRCQEKGCGSSTEGRDDAAAGGVVDGRHAGTHPTTAASAGAHDRWTIVVTRTHRRSPARRYRPGVVHFRRRHAQT